jgi:hypothetical protein
MKLAARVAGGMLVLLALGSVLGSARAETKLTDFNGTWQGIGTDRNTPFESVQRTRCNATINADLHRMGAGIVCNGVAGLSKVIQLNITLAAAGDAFSGDLTQKATVRGNASSETVLQGSVSGHKTDKTANFRVSFPGLTPSVDVTLTLIDPGTFSMHATTFGGELMDITFSKTSKP